MPTKTGWMVLCLAATGLLQAREPRPQARLRPRTPAAHLGVALKAGCLPGLPPPPAPRPGEQLHMVPTGVPGAGPSLPAALLTPGCRF